VSDVVGYILILGLFVFPAYGAIQLAERIMYAVFENQSILLSFPFP
jgi:ABC-type Mn2+/Zn2+ transport system permease subunit